MPSGFAALLVETGICLTSSSSVPDVWQNAVVAAGVAGLGASLYLVHMYVTPIKRFMQVRIRLHLLASSHFIASACQLHTFPHAMQGLYGAGAAGALGLALTQVITPSVHTMLLILWFHDSQQTTVAGLGLKQDVLSWICEVQNGQAVPRYVAEHPAAVWLVGPFFAAVTGLAFKEVSLSPP